MEFLRYSNTLRSGGPPGIVHGYPYQKRRATSESPGPIGIRICRYCGDQRRYGADHQTCSGRFLFVGQKRMESTNSSLILRLRKTGSEEDWREFFSIYRPFLVAVSLRFGLDVHRADDVAAEVLAICATKLREFEYDRNQGRFRGWLKTVTQRVIYGNNRKERAGPRLVPLPAHDIPVGDAGFWDRWNQYHREYVVKTALEIARRETRREEKWACFDHHILQRIPAGEVAGKLGISTTLVYNNASRVLARVRDLCTRLDEELDHD